MSRTQKTMGRLPMALRVHRLTPDGIPLPTTAVVTPWVDSSEPAHLRCECGQPSDATEWGSENEPNVVGPRCPHCGNQYALSEQVPQAELPPAEVAASVEMKASTEPQESSGSEVVSRDGAVERLVVLTSDAQATVGALNTEWLDLDLKLELLVDEKKAYLDDWKGKVSVIDERIAQIKAELRAIQAGRTYEVPPPKAPKQQPLPFGGQ